MSNGAPPLQRERLLLWRALGHGNGHDNEGQPWRGQRATQGHGQRAAQRRGNGHGSAPKHTPAAMVARHAGATSRGACAGVRRAAATAGGGHGWLAAGARGGGAGREKGELGLGMRSNGGKVWHKSQTLEGGEIKIFRKMDRNSG